MTFLKNKCFNHMCSTGNKVSNSHVATTYIQCVIYIAWFSLNLFKAKDIFESYFNLFINFILATFFQTQDQHKKLCQWYHETGNSVVPYLKYSASKSFWFLLAMFKFIYHIGINTWYIVWLKYFSKICIKLVIFYS